MTRSPRGLQDRYAEWSPDGSTIAFRRKGDGVADLYVVTVPEDANGVVDVAQAQETRLLRDDLSYWATEPLAWAMALPVGFTAGDDIRLDSLRCVAVQPVPSNNKS